MSARDHACQRVRRQEFPLLLIWLQSPEAAALVTVPRRPAQALTGCLGLTWNASSDSFKATMCLQLRQSAAMSQLRHAYACARSSAQLGKRGLPGKTGCGELPKQVRYLRRSRRCLMSAKQPKRVHLHVTAQEQKATGMPGRYATALFELAQENNSVSQVSADLDSFAAMLDSSDDLTRLVRSPVFGAGDQIAALDAVFAQGRHQVNCSKFHQAGGQKPPAFCGQGHDRRLQVVGCRGARRNCS